MRKSPECKDCIKEGRRNWRPVPYSGPRCATHHHERRRARREVSREQRVKKRYSLPAEQYRALMLKQGGMCAICKRYKANSVDHDHACCDGPSSCGKCVRGLLCRTCNTILGRWRDDAETFLRAAAYLQAPPAQEQGSLEVPEEPVVHPPVSSVDTEDNKALTCREQGCNAPAVGHWLVHPANIYAELCQEHGDYYMGKHTKQAAKHRQADRVRPYVKHRREDEKDDQQEENQDVEQEKE